MTSEGPPCLLSVHDVMPETLDRVGRILRRLETLGNPPVTLLVVPGKPWSTAELERLRSWVRKGHILAAHGWAHRISKIGGMFHWLHARFLSRNVAEHLSLDSADIVKLMRRSRGWFIENGFDTPALYVPPAWALGFLERGDCATLPFAQIEVTRGLLNPATGQLRSLPLVGFEADTAFRRLFVFCWNALQVRIARRRRMPLRFSLHPDDFELLLREQLESILQMGWTFAEYPQIEG